MAGRIKSEIKLDNITNVPVPTEDAPPKNNAVFEAQNITKKDLTDLKTQAEIDDLTCLTGLKKEIAKYAQTLSTSSIIIWSSVILIHIITTLLGCPAFSENIFIAITTGCTVNIFSVLLAVTRGLFKS